MPYKDPEYQAKYYLSHRELLKARANRYYHDHSKELYENHVEWRARNPEVLKAQSDTWNHKRIARKFNADGSHTESDIAAIYEAQDGLCYYCGDPLEVNFHRDHKQPLSRGGSDSPENLVCTCQHCNLSKGAQTESEFVLRQFAGSPCSTVNTVYA
jgi:5-methylcytosine-specific restriction endonuclease McrA